MAVALSEGRRGRVKGAGQKNMPAEFVPLLGKRMSWNLTFSPSK